MEPSVSQINTQRLKPLCQRTTRTVMSILENGDVSMEILAKPQSGDQEGSQTVQEMVHISGDGTKVQLYQNTQGNTCGSEGKEGDWCWTLQEFVFPDLPPKQLKKYMHAFRFVELVKSRTPKIVLTTDRAKCKLMENSPFPDFLVDFHDGTSILLSKRKVHITDSDGNSATSEVDNFVQSYPDDVLERYVYSKQCETECQRLVGSFTNFKTNHESPELFPISIGTSTCPVTIPLSQQTTTTNNINPPTTLLPNFSDNQPYLVNQAYQQPVEAEAMLLEPPYCYNPTNTAFSIPTQNIDRQPSNIETCSTPASCVQQQLYNTPHVTHINKPENMHPHPQLEHDTNELHRSSDCSQSNLLLIENGANFPNATNDIPQACQSQSSFVKQDDGLCEKYPFHHSIGSSCLPEFTPQQTNNCAQISKQQCFSESYDKFKYCSRTSNAGTIDQDELVLQQQYLQEEFFAEHLDMSSLRVREHTEVPCPRHCITNQQTNPGFISLNHQGNAQATDGVTQTATQSLPSSCNVSIHNQKFSSFSSSRDKRIVRNPLPSKNSSGIGEKASPSIQTELVSTCSFTPMQSGSAIAAYPEPNNSQSPKKIQRKILSLDLSTALENQMKSLDLSSSQSDSTNGGTPHSTGNETHLYSTQNLLLKNTPKNFSFNSTFSNCKISDRLRARQDQLNSSLPLSYDSKQFGMSSIPATPQKQFLQSSDTSVDHGSSEFGLPPQVRHSLDLSTSSNYSDSPSSSQSSSCEPLYQVFVPYVGWASYYASGAVWVLYNDGTQLGVKANEKTMTFIEQDGSQKKYNNKDIVPDVVKMKLEKFPSILTAVLNGQR